MLKQKVVFFVSVLSIAASIAFIANQVLAVEIDMGGGRIRNLAPGTLDTDAATYGQVLGVTGGVSPGAANQTLRWDEVGASWAASSILTNDGTTIGVANNLTVSGDGTFGSTGRAANTSVKALAGDAYNAGFEAYGFSQGTGYLYVGQSTTYGGGIFYNGDGSPAFATGEAADRISFYRKNAGTNEVVFSYLYNSNDVSFRGNLTVAGIPNCNTVDTNASGQLVCGTDAVDDTVSWSEISGIVGTGANTVAAGNDSRFHTRNRDYALAASDGSPIDAVYVDATGSVGIGITGPLTEDLHVYDAANHAGIKVQTGTAGKSAAIFLQDTNTTVTLQNVGDLSPRFIIGFTAGSGSLTVKSDGTAGVHDITPDYGWDVAGDTNTTGVFRRGGVAGINVNCPAGEALTDITSSGGIVTAGGCQPVGGGASVGGAGAVQYSDGAGGFDAVNTFFYDESLGSLGIGTTAPEGSLHSLGKSASIINDYSNTIYTGGGDMYPGTTYQYSSKKGGGGGYTTASTGGGGTAAGIFIGGQGGSSYGGGGAGIVAIGGDSGNIYGGGGAGIYAKAGSSGGSSNGIKTAGYFDGNGANAMLAMNGNVGIGDNTPDAKLDILNTGTGASFRVDDSTDGDTTPFIIDADGNVGIGTNDPSTNKLRVVGGPIKAEGGLIIQTIFSGTQPSTVGSIWMCTDADGQCNGN